MPKDPKRTDKYYWLDAAKIKRAQKALGAKTERETIDRALDLAIELAERGLLNVTPFPSATLPSDTSSRAR
jgi:hypothetical protein